MAIKLRAKKDVPLNAKMGEWDAIRTRASMTCADSNNATPDSDVPKWAQAQTADFNSNISSIVSIAPLITTCEHEQTNANYKR